MINHSLNINIIPIGDGVIVSDPLDAPTTNSVASWAVVPGLNTPAKLKFSRITANVNGCVSLSGANFNPQFLLLDFVNIGEGFEAADRLNGLLWVHHIFLMARNIACRREKPVTCTNCQWYQYQSVGWHMFCFRFRILLVNKRVRERCCMYWCHCLGLGR